MHYVNYKTNEYILLFMDIVLSGNRHISATLLLLLLLVIVIVIVVVVVVVVVVGRDSVLGIATRYGLKGTGMESRGSEIFRTRIHWLWGPSSLPYSGYRVIPGNISAGAWR
jgi:hypothetical protein